MNRQKIFKLFFISLILCASIAFAQEKPSRNDASAEYCIRLTEPSIFILTKILEPIPSFSLSPTDTIWCDGYYSRTEIDFDFPGKGPALSGNLGGGGGGCVIIKTLDVVISQGPRPQAQDTTEHKKYPPKKYGQKCSSPYSAVFNVDFPPTQELPPPQKGIDTTTYITQLFGKVIPVHWKTIFRCDPNTSTLENTYYIYITGLCPKGTKIMEAKPVPPRRFSSQEKFSDDEE